MLLVREMRIKSGLSQKELAKRSGLSQQMISGIEVGRYKNPGVSIVYAIARAMGLSMTDIYKPNDENAA